MSSEWFIAINNMDRGKVMEKKISIILHYFSHLKDRVIHDRLAVNAGYMAYITLLSLVPLLTVVVTALSKFPVFEGISHQIQDFAFENFVPAAGDAVKEALNTFISNTSGMSAVGWCLCFYYRNVIDFNH